MSRIPDNPLPIDDAAFDRLADGEMSEPERALFLAGLDQVPGGWRRCALAFLEAQCWRDELRVMTPPAREPAPRPAASRRRSSSAGGVWGTLAAMAASFVVALAGGWLVSEWMRSPAAVPGGSAPSIAGTEPAAPPEREAVAQPAAVAQQGPAGSPGWQMVACPVSDGPSGVSRSIQLPAFEHASADPRWHESLPPPVPEDVLESLRRSGHEVRQTRQFVPVLLQDGRQTVFPVDQVEVRFVGSRGYQ